MTPCIKNKRVVIDPIIVIIPNGSSVTSTHTCEIDLPSLLPTAKQTHIFPHFLAVILLSTRIYYNAGNTVELDTTTLHIIYDKKVVLTGTCSPDTKLWCLDPTSAPTTAIVSIDR